MIPSTGEIKLKSWPNSAQDITLTEIQMKALVSIITSIITFGFQSNLNPV